MIRRILIIALIATGSATLATAAPAHAIQSCGHNVDCRWQWYSDSTYKTLVGFREIDCVGNWSQQGTVTRFQSYSAKNCG